MILSVVALVVCYPFDPARRVVHYLSKMMVHIFFGIPPYWRCKVEGAEYIDRNKSYVMVMNHNAMMDIPVPYLLPLNFRWVSKREVFQIPFFGQFLVLHGDIAIQRGNGAAAMTQVIKEGKMWISRGASVAIFPEGTRSRTGEIGRFKAGAFNLAREAGVEILPIVIDGTRDIIHKGGAFNWHSNMTLKVLPPVKFETEDHAEGRAIMDKLNQDMKDALQLIREAKQKK
ncbi:MAG: lysophospholipid acyltransferase family protein [Rikenellaceae bacterium]